MLPSEERVVARAPGGEVVPEPQAGEHVVFACHFPRGFGLPVSLFFRLLLDTFDLQPHHLGPNAILYIASFVTLCEGYLGMLPFVELFRKLFYLKALKNKDEAPYACGGAVVCCRGPHFPRIDLIDSVQG
jgi:hypothetical protein